MANPSTTSTEQLPIQLITEVSSQCNREVSADFALFVDALTTRFGSSLDAVLLYGSCLRSGNLDEGIVDLYVIVDDYKKAYSERHLSVLNAWLAPNVFYLEVAHGDKTLRAKYAVISTADFERGAQYWFHSYIWARFAQPSRLLYARDEPTRQRIYLAIAHAVVTFLESGIQALKAEPVNVEDIWTRCLMFTYAAELRAEQETRARDLAQLNLDDFSKLTTAAESALAGLLKSQSDGTYQCLSDNKMRKKALWHWRLRRWQGRILSILRLSKATITFRDCLDYAAWKIERHTGIRVEITPMLRRHPIMWGFKVMWQLLRRGALR
jgi:predicted nucleotidyltransferase